MNLENINVTVDVPPTDDPPDPVLELTTDDYDIFQGDVISYFQFMSQMSINLSVGTSSTQYEPPCVSSYRILDPFTQVLETQSDEIERHE
jgi:hypothetical protein